MSDAPGRVRVNRAAVLLTVLSFAFWGTWHLARHQCHPFADLSCGVYTDHFSHMNTARLFMHEGIGIWTRPLLDNGRPLTDEERAALPADLAPISPHDMRAVPGFPPDKPFFTSWGDSPRFHPPGDMLLTAPVAALYSWTPLSFSWANKLLILLFLLYAHVSIFLLLSSALRYDRASPVGVLVLFVVYGECVHWALEGFYEPLVIAPLVLCGRYLYERRGLAAVTAYSAAVFLHFRALFLLPLGLYAIYLVIDQREWEGWKRKQYVQAAAAFFMGGWAFFVLILVWPYLRVLPANASVSLVAGSLDIPAIVTFGIVMAVVGAALVYARAWLDVAILGCVVVILAMLRQAYGWDILSLLAWLGLPLVFGREDRVPIARDARLAAVFYIAVAVFGNTLMPGWLNRVFT